MKRRSLLGGAAALPRAQQPTLPVIALLSSGSPSERQGGSSIIGI